MYKMCEKMASDVSLKYLSPGEELSPDNLISVTDDEDVQASNFLNLPNMLLHEMQRLQCLVAKVASLLCSLLACTF